MNIAFAGHRLRVHTAITNRQKQQCRREMVFSGKPAYIGDKVVNFESIFNPFCSTCRERQAPIAAMLGADYSAGLCVN
jgi:hypothetical protein